MAKNLLVAVISIPTQLATAGTLLSLTVYLLTAAWLYIGGAANAFSTGIPYINAFLPVDYSTRAANRVFAMALLSSNVLIVLSALCLPVIRSSGWTIVAFWVTMVCSIVSAFFALVVYKAFLFAGLCYFGSSLLFLAAYRHFKQSKKALEKA